MCGVTTGGSENCEWDCIPRGGGFYSNPECLLDCFPEGHCVKKLLGDYLTVGGICAESSFGDQIKDILPATSKECEYITIPIGENNVPHNFTINGILKEETLEALYENENCIYDVHRKSSAVYGTISILVYTSSNIQAIRNWFFFKGRTLMVLFRHSGKSFARYMFGLTETVSTLPWTSDGLHLGLK